MLTLYGIRTCDTVRKARAWLDAASMPHRFHDFRVDGLDAERLALWLDQLGWDAVLNRASSTFRGLDEGKRTDLDRHKAAALMLADPTMVKRPVLERGSAAMVGFKPERYAAFLANETVRRPSTA